MLFRTDKRQVNVEVNMWDADKHEWDTSFSMEETAREDAYSIVGFFAKEVKDSDWVYAPTWWECKDEEVLCDESCDFDPEGGDYFALSIHPVDDDGFYLDIEG